MKRTLLLLAVLTLAVAGCTRPAPGLAQPVTVTSDISAEVFGAAGMVWAEGDTRPAISHLVPDLKEGVWGGQDGELFHFRVRADHSYGRITYGRPHPAAVWLGDLVRLSEQELAGRVTTLHLVRRGKDGTVTDLAPARSPAGAAFDWLDVREGKLLLHDRLDTWYIWIPESKAFQPVTEFYPEHIQSRLGLDAPAQQAVESGAGGQVQAWGVLLPDGSSYALIEREQLFRFDTVAHSFTLLGNPGLQPLGAVGGQIVARSGAGLTLVDPQGRVTRTVAIEPQTFNILQGEGGWFHNLPSLSVNLLTGEERRYQYQDSDLAFAATSALIPLGEGQMLGATSHWGSLFRFDPLTGARQIWGRPIPELGQESGEEVAPIDGLALGSDGFLYAAVGTGARGTRESHLVRLDQSGKVLAKTWLPEPVHGLVTGADGRIYGAGYARVIVIPTANQPR